MKCEEVVEWMHRYLDHDLGEAETAQMLQHVAKCPECAENFSLLRALSRELEELPQVSPKFSLVDAIMPQLDAIDEARKEQSSTVQEMNPVPATFENLQRSSERKTKQKWLNSMAGRMSMGAAAAAVVLGFAIWGYQPEQIENADSLLMSSGASQESGNVDQNPLRKSIENDSAASSTPSSNDVFVDQSNISPAEPDNQGEKQLLKRTVEKRYRSLRLSQIRHLNNRLPNLSLLRTKEHETIHPVLLRRIARRVSLRTKIPSKKIQIQEVRLELLQMGKTME
ncbi:anti-sigma factor [Paenibacillus amylolyticus]|nr:anti-sigma factor [Paenibacillus amylolyticus]WFR65204.1 anti-sigma factor [Paenibacillus amylolyticus]